MTERLPFTSVRQQSTRRRTTAERAASYWRRRHGETAVFDADDARQEAAIAMWQEGGDAVGVGYRRIIDAVRRLFPGVRAGRQLRVVPAEDREGNVWDFADSAPGPEQRALWGQRIRYLASHLSAADQSLASRVLAGQTLSSIAAEDGVSGFTVSARFEGILRALAAADEPAMSSRLDGAPAPSCAAPDDDASRAAHAAAVLYQDAMKG